MRWAKSLLEELGGAEGRASTIDMKMKKESAIAM